MTGWSNIQPYNQIINPSIKDIVPEDSTWPLSRHTLGPVTMTI